MEWQPLDATIGMQPNSTATGVCHWVVMAAWDNGKSCPRAHELDQRLERTEQQLRLLQKISRCMVRDMSLQAALDGVVTLVVDFMECDSCLLYLLDNHELVLRATNRPVGGARQREADASTKDLTGWVAREKRLLAISREAFAIRDLSSSPIFPKTPTKRSCRRRCSRDVAWRASSTCSIAIRTRIPGSRWNCFRALVNNWAAC